MTYLTILDIHLYDKTRLLYNFNNVNQSFTLEINPQIDFCVESNYSSMGGINDKN